MARGLAPHRIAITARIMDSIDRRTDPGPVEYPKHQEKAPSCGLFAIAMAPCRRSASRRTILCVGAEIHLHSLRRIGRIRRHLAFSRERNCRNSSAHLRWSVSWTDFLFHFRPSARRFLQIEMGVGDRCCISASCTWRCETLARIVRSGVGLPVAFAFPKSKDCDSNVPIHGRMNRSGLCMNELCCELIAADVRRVMFPRGRLATAGYEFWGWLPPR